MQDTIYKALMFLFWPLLAVFIVAVLAVMLVCAWPVIPFGKVVRTPDGGVSIKFGE